MKIELTETGDLYNIFQLHTRFEDLTELQSGEIRNILGVVQLLQYKYSFCLKVGKAFTLEEIETELKKILQK